MFKVIGCSAYCGFVLSTALVLADSIPLPAWWWYMYAFSGVVAALWLLSVVHVRVSVEYGKGYRYGRKVKSWDIDEA